MTAQLIESAEQPRRGKRAASRDALETNRHIMATLEALLPQYRVMCTAFYQHQPHDAHPIAAYRWLHRELISRFGAQAVLNLSRRINARLKCAQQGVIAALEVA